MKKFLGLIIITAICACNNNDNKTHVNEPFTGETINIEPNSRNNVLSKIVTDYKFIPFETNDSTLLGEINKVLLYKSRIFVLDSYHSKSLKVFNQDGKFLHQIGRIGFGHGEYTIPYDFTINFDNDEVSVLNASGILITYDLDGKYLRDENLSTFSPFKCEVTPDGYVLIGGRGSENLIVTDNNKTDKLKRFPFISPRVDKLLIDPIQKIDNSNLIYRRNLNDTIFNLQKYVLSARYLLNFKGQKITYNAVADNMVSEKEIKIAYRIKSYYETKDFIYIAFTYNDVPYMSLYSKEKKTIEVLKYTSTKNDITFEKYSNFAIGADYDSNTLIFIVTPSSLLKGEAEIKSLPTSPQTKKIKSLIAQVNLASNPILCLASLK